VPTIFISNLDGKTGFSHLQNVTCSVFESPYLLLNGPRSGFNARIIESCAAGIDEFIR
jgi:hypothetical protein